MVASLSNPRIYLDTNVFIAAYETRSARSDHAWWVLEAVEASEFLAVTSELTLAEMLVRPLQDGDKELAARYQDIVTSGDGLTVGPVDRKTLIEAAMLRSFSRSL